MELSQLRHFQAVARCGSVTKAARELYITQPSLSKSIAHLEEELGVPLFVHRKGKVELNDYGRMFLSSVDIAFAQLNTGMQAVRRSYENDQHILSLACNISGYLPDTLPAFFSAHPEIGIRQRDADTRQMVELLLDRSVNLGISCETIHNDQIEFRELGQKEFVLAVHESSPLAVNERVTIGQLKEQTFICDSTRLRLEPLRRLCLKEGFSPKVGFEIESSELIFSLVEGGHGIAILPIGLCCQLLHRHPKSHLRLVRIDADLPPIIIGIARLKGVQETRASALFEEFVKAGLREEERLIADMGYGPSVSP